MLATKLRTLCVGTKWCFDTGFLDSFVRLWQTLRSPQSPGGLGSSIVCFLCCWISCSFAEFNFALLLFNSLICSAALNLIQMPCVCVFEIWPFNSQKSLGKLSGFGLCKGSHRFEFWPPIDALKRLKRRLQLHIWVLPGELGEKNRNGDRQIGIMWDVKCLRWLVIFPYIVITIHHNALEM